MRRVQVLELVHQEGAAPRPDGLAGVWLGDEDLDRPVDLLVEIERAGVSERRAIAVEAVANTHGVREAPLRRARVDELQPDGRQGLEVGGQHVRIRPPADGKRCLDESAGVHLVEDPKPTRCAEFVADVVGEAVDRADVG